MNVMAIGAHPDDIELSMSGTIFKYSETSFDILCLTSGSKGDSTSSYKRIDEVKNFW